MAGLLDFLAPVTTDASPAGRRGLLGDSFDDPRTAATLQLAQGLLGSRNTMQGIAQGLLGYQGTMQQAKQQASADEMRRTQLAHMQLQYQQQLQAQQQADRDRELTRLAYADVKPIEANKASGIAGPRPEALGVVGQRPPFDARAFIAAGGTPALAFQMEQSLRKEQPKLEKFSPGEIGGYFQNGQWQQVVNNPKAPDVPAEIQQYQLAVQQGYKGTIQQFELEKRRAGAQAITVDMRGDNAYSTAQGKEYSDLMAGINKAGFAAPAQMRKLERLSSLLEGVEGGKLSPVGLDIASALNGYGVKIDPRLGNKEAAQALSRELAGGLRQPGTGPMTDKDFDNFLAQIPDLSKSAAGRKQITTTMQAALNRDIKVSQLAREYERRHGRIDGGFLDQVATFVAENPVVAPPSGWVVQR